MAARLSSRGGDRSISSSVMLKSPIRKSGRGRRFVCLAVSTSSQKAGCLWSWTGAYMLMILISSSSGHLILSMIALPGTRVCALGCLFGIRALFSTKATPALAHGLTGSLEYSRSKFFPKHLRMHSAFSSSRWVS